MFEIRSEPLDLHEVIEAVQDDTAGAIDLFVGRVRNHDRGQSVTELEYEAYTTMAEAEMARIGEELRAAFSGVRLAVIHRVGRLQVGDAAIVAAASAPHRAEAFAATRRLVDEVKARVPIWKRQFGPDGVTWIGWEDARCTDHAHHAPPQEAGRTNSHASTSAGILMHDTHVKSGLRNGTGLQLGVVTLSDSRGPENDPSGDLLAFELEAAGHHVRRHHMADDPLALTTWIRATAPALDAIVTTGGTGITGRDQTWEALDRLLEKRIDGFGEAFRRLSFDEVGPRGLLSRAIAGTLGTCLVFALPGSKNAVALGVNRLIVPLLPHAVAMAKG